MNAGSRICQPITHAHCSRERIRGSKRMTKSPSRCLSVCFRQSACSNRRDITLQRESGPTRANHPRSDTRLRCETSHQRISIAIQRWGGMIISLYDRGALRPRPWARRHREQFEDAPAGLPRPCSRCFRSSGAFANNRNGYCERSETIQLSAIAYFPDRAAAVGLWIASSLRSSQ